MFDHIDAQPVPGEGVLHRNDHALVLVTSTPTASQSEALSVWARTSPTEPLPDTPGVAALSWTGQRFHIHATGPMLVIVSSSSGQLTFELGEDEALSSLGLRSITSVECRQPEHRSDMPDPFETLSKGTRSASGFVATFQPPLPIEDSSLISGERVEVATTQTPLASEPTAADSSPERSDSANTDSGDDEVQHVEEVHLFPSEPAVSVQPESTPEPPAETPTDTQPETPTDAQPKTLPEPPTDAQPETPPEPPAEAQQAETPTEPPKDAPPETPPEPPTDAQLETPPETPPEPPSSLADNDADGDLERSDAFVLGVVCPQCQTFNHPNAPYCHVDGHRLVETRVLQRSRRPTLGHLRLSHDGTHFQLYKTVVLGRAPDVSPLVDSNEADGIQLEDPSMNLSRSHAVVELRDWGVYLRDDDSQNGTWLIAPNGSRRRLSVGEEIELTQETMFSLGQSIVTFFPAPFY